MFPSPGNLPCFLRLLLGELTNGGNLDVDMFDWEVIAGG